MGWLYGWDTRKALIDHLTQGNGVKTIKHCLKGNDMWAVQEGTKTDGTQETFIALYLLRGMDTYNKRTGTYRPNGGWGYKDMDESAGPNATSCPFSYLDMVPDPKIGYSTEWRARVLERAARGKRQLVPGMKIKLYGKEYTVHDKRPNRMGYTISTGYERYRLKLSQVKDVEVLG